MVKRAQQNAPTSEIVQGDALALPLPDGSVDVAFAASVVNLVDAPQELVSELARVTRPGGRISVLFPTPQLQEMATTIGTQRALPGLSAAALAFWGTRAPKRDPEVILPLFEHAGLRDIRINRIFHGTIACVTGLKP